VNTPRKTEKPAFRRMQIMANRANRPARAAHASGALSACLASDKNFEPLLRAVSISDIFSDYI
jgi:hypothetical protein